MNINLHADTTRKMLNRFLTEKRVSKEELSKILGVSAKEIEQFFICEASSELISRVSLPLAKLYCETKW